MAQVTRELPELLDAKQVATYLKLNEVTVVRFARRGRLPGFKVGREWRFRADDIRAWVERQTPSFAEQFDALWNRIGDRARRAGYGPDDVPRLVAEVREERRARREGSGA